MAIAKSAPQVAQTTAVVEKPSLEGYSSFLYDGVDISVYGFFDLDVGKASDTEKTRLKDIYDWAMSENKSIGDGMQRIRSLETQLGQPPIGTTRLNKLWNWIKISRQIDDLRKRQDSLENRRIYA